MHIQAYVLGSMGKANIISFIHNFFHARKHCGLFELSLKFFGDSGIRTQNLSVTIQPQWPLDRHMGHNTYQSIGSWF